VAPNRAHGPLPQESSFVEAARESIPQSRVRVTTATTRSNLRGSARGRGRNSSVPVGNDEKQASRGRGRVKNTSTRVGGDGKQPISGRARAKRR
jgi:hypothetical protein